MKLSLFLLLASLAPAQSWIMQPAGTTASLRGVSVVSADVVWASGTGGTYLRTLDGGKTWHAQAVPGAATLDFRGVRAFSPNEALLMASGDGAQSAVYQTADGGVTWKLLYPNRDAKGFFDAIVAPKPGTGWVLGDPVDGMFTLFRIDRAGTVYPHIQLPAALAGEGAFAASNTSLAIRGSHIWFATGGKGAARIFRSDDAGKHWTVAATPLRNDGDGAGIFSLAFSDDRHGVMVGGLYTKPADSAHNVAITSDGGVTWREPAGAHPRGYRSAVAWLPKAKLWVTTGPAGSEFSRDGGETWTPFDEGAFNAIGADAEDHCWAVGGKGRIARLDLSSLH
jgi:photosystem II stability/assembly factor-like uncharacterized protein